MGMGGMDGMGMGTPPSRRYHGGGRYGGYGGYGGHGGWGGPPGGYGYASGLGVPRGALGMGDDLVEAGDAERWVLRSR